MRALARVFPVSLVAAVTFEAVASQTPSSQFQATTTLVVVAANVWDAAGQPLLDLAASDFDLRDDGTPVAVEVADGATTPIALGLLYTREAVLGIEIATQRAALNFLSAELGPDGLVSMANTTSQPGPLGPPTIRAIVGLVPRMGPEKNPLDSLSEVVDVLALSTFRRAITVISMDRESRPIPPQRLSLGDVSRKVQRAGVVVHSLQVGHGRPHPGVERLVKGAGGVAVKVDEETRVAGELALVARRMREAYTLGFRPRTLDGKTHKLEIRVRRPGVTVRARSEYVAYK